MSLVRIRRVVCAVSLAVFATTGAFALGMPSASAASGDRYVTTSGSDTSNDCTDSSNPCKTIQHAVDQSSDGDTIHVAAGTYPESVENGVDNGGDNLTIVGAGEGATKVTGTGLANGTINADFGFFFSGRTATLRDLTVTDVARPTSQNGLSPGIGIISFGELAPNAAPSASAPTTITLDGVESSGNADGGAFIEAGNLSATGSTFDDNGSAGDLNEGFLGCGAIVIAGTASIDTSSASSNAVCGVAGLSGFGVGAEARTHAAAPSADAGFTFSHSTAANNKAPGVLVYQTSSAEVFDSTLAGNAGGGVYIGNSNLSVVHSTITGTKKYDVNDVPDQAGIGVEDATTQDNAFRPSPAHLRSLARRLHAPAFRPAATAPTASTVSVSGSIVADNTVPDCSQKLDESDYDISSDSANSCGLTSGSHSLPKTGPKLGALGDHGGSTQTQLPLKGSPAIDAEPDGTSGCEDAAKDQRGVLRPQPSGGRCDIGSVELAADPLAISPDSLPHGTVGKSYSATVTATGGQYPTYVWSLAGGSLPPGIDFSDGHFTGTPTKAGTYSVTVSVNDPVEKTYTIVIDDAGTGSGGKHGGNGGGGQLANTGVPTLALTNIGVVLLLAGGIALYFGIVSGRRGRHRRSAA